MRGADELQRFLELETRSKQKAEFERAFGFAPPASITEIRCAGSRVSGDELQRSHEYWMRLTFDPEVFDKMVKANGCRKNAASILHSGSRKPRWWPQDRAGDYVRALQNESRIFFFTEQWWHDQTAGLIYWHQVLND